MNDDYEKRALININKIFWDVTKTKGVFRKLLSKKDEEETSILKFEENSILNRLCLHKGTKSDSCLKYSLI